MGRESADLRCEDLDVQAEADSEAVEVAVACDGAGEVFCAAEGESVGDEGGVHILGSFLLEPQNVKVFVNPRTRRRRVQ